MNSAACAAYRFDSFEVRVRSGFLLREGKRVRIEELPFRMLVVLLERQGQVVSREELRHRLWGENRFGEFDNSLHVAATKLREALGDHAGDPRYVETVRRRGYQFIGEAEQLFDEEPVAAPDEVSQAAAVEEEQPVAVRRRWLPPAAAAIAAVAVLAAAGTLIYRWREMRPLAGSQDRVVLGGFTNNTGDDSYNRVLLLAFRVKLNESPYLNLIPEQQLKQLGKGAGMTSLAEELHACVALHGQILLRGELTAQSQGDQVRLSAWQCATGRLLVTEKAHADSRAKILPALDAATQQLRRRMGESESSLQRFNVPLTQATTASQAALNAFTRGEEKRSDGQEMDAISDYRLAVDLDPQFAIAYARLGTIYSNSGEHALSRRYYQKAFDLRERATDRERLYIATHYYLSTGELQRSIDAYELWHSVYPRDMAPSNNLSNEYLVIGKPEKSVDLALAAIRADPAVSRPYGTLAQAYLRSGRYAELGSLCADPARAGMDILSFHNACFLLAFTRQDMAGMQRELRGVHGNSAESELIEEAAWAAMYGGRVEEARRLFAEAEQNARQNNLAEFAVEVDLDEANLEADLGFVREASVRAHHALKGAPDSADVQAYAALALAQVGDAAGSEREARMLKAESPEDTILNSVVLASAQALTQLQRHDPAGAIQALERARPLELCNAMELAPVYYRGLAYMAGKHYAEAAKEFQKVIDHRALVPDSPYIPLALLNSGRALRLAGDRANAARSYQQAEVIWKNADADFPPLKQLVKEQHELAALR